MTCENVGADCVYPDQPKRIFVSEKEWNDLQARADAAETVSSLSTGPTSPPITEETGNNEDDWWFKNREMLIVSRSGEHRIVGASHSTYLATQLNPASKGSVAFDVSPINHAKLALRRGLGVLPDLPPFETAKQWYEAQFAYIGSIFSFVQPKYFEERLSEVYSRSPDASNREDCLLYCQILLVLAFGQMYSLNQWTSSDGPPGFSYFQAALSLLPDVHEEGSILFVEVLGLVSYFMQILNRRYSETSTTPRLD
ncbi:Transcriptional activator [Lithohypha guttulata]|uniref:Transcriptional activator n=1 Tax=Lithohypha guttulata TaxID=1690604 RepID=UPI002DDF8074|nr:Transcriptional activator [Lithohypha guttulata]